MQKLFIFILVIMSPALGQAEDIYGDLSVYGMLSAPTATGIDNDGLTLADNDGVFIQDYRMPDSHGTDGQVMTVDSDNDIGYSNISSYWDYVDVIPPVLYNSNMESNIGLGTNIVIDRFQVGYLSDTNITEVPAMTSNTAPYGIAFLDGQHGDESDAYLAFDGDDVTAAEYYHGYIDSSIGYEFVNEKSLEAYALFSSWGYPTSWQFQGFTDSGWVTLDTQTGQAPTTLTTYVIPPENVISCIKYRVLFSTYSQNRWLLRVLELYTSVSTVVGIAMDNDGNVAMGESATPIQYKKLTVVCETDDSTAYGIEVNDSNNNSIFAVRCDGQVYAPNIPLIDPAVAGWLWVDNDTIKISN